MKMPRRGPDLCPALLFWRRVEHQVRELTYPTERIHGRSPKLAGGVREPFHQSTVLTEPASTDLAHFILQGAPIHKAL